VFACYKWVESGVTADGLNIVIIRAAFAPFAMANTACSPLAGQPDAQPGAREWPQWRRAHPVAVRPQYSRVPYPVLESAVPTYSRVPYPRTTGTGTASALGQWRRAHAVTVRARARVCRVCARMCVRASVNA
jgi:hypothetical protein